MEAIVRKSTLNCVPCLVLIYCFSIVHVHTAHDSICFSYSLCRNVGEELANEGDQVGAAVATAQTKIISQVSWVVSLLSSPPSQSFPGLDHFSLDSFLQQSAILLLIRLIPSPDCEEEHNREHRANCDFSEAPFRTKTLSTTQRSPALPQRTHAGERCIRWSLCLILRLDINLF